MIGYVTLGVSDMDKAKQFYSDLLADMGAKVLMDMGRIAFIGKDRSSPLLAVCTPFNGEPNHPGNGNMLALQPGSKEAVDSYYKKAISWVPPVTVSLGSASRTSSTVPTCAIRTATSWRFITSADQPPATGPGTCCRPHCLPHSLRFYSLTPTDGAGTAPVRLRKTLRQWPPAPAFGATPPPARHPGTEWPGAWCGPRCRSGCRWRWWRTGE